VDDGDFGELVEVHPPLTLLSTPRGVHLPYRDSIPRPNGKWSAFGCAGDVRSARGFIRLYVGGVERLADALARAPADEHRFPTDLFEAAGVPAPAVPERSHDPALAPRRPRLPDLATVREGARNAALFDTLRFWAYDQLPGPDVALWSAHVHAEAIRRNACFPAPLPAREVERTAHSISTWIYSGGVHLDRRGRGGWSKQRHRGRISGMRRRHRTAGRDAAIVERVRSGESIRAVARDLGLTPKAVRHIVNRDREPEQARLPGVQ